MMSSNLLLQGAKSCGQYCPKDEVYSPLLDKVSGLLLCNKQKGRTKNEEIIYI